MGTRLKFYFTQPVTWVKVVVLLTYLILILSYIGRYETNLSSLINIGEQDSNFSKDKVDKGFIVFRHGGYDGQHNYYIAKDFLFKGNFHNPYRYQRILYPALVWLISLGQGKWMPLLFVLINLVSIWIGMTYLMRLFERESAVNLFLTALYGFNIGFLITVIYDLGTPLAIMLLLMAVYYFQKEKMDYSTICLSLSLLTMENAWLVIVPLFFWVIWNKEYNKLKILSLCIIPWILWQCILWWKLGQLPIIASAGFLSYPFYGLWEYFQTKPWSATHPDDLLRQINVLPFMIFVMAILIIVSIQWYYEKSIYACLVLFHALFAMFLSYEHIWSHTITSSTRILTGVFPFLFLLYVHSERKRLLSLLITGSWLLTVLGLLRFAYLPQHSYFLIVK